jgi:hypothetical protein
MNEMMQVLETVYRMKKGATVQFTSGASVECVKRNDFRVTDKNGKTYSSLNKDHAAMIAYKGE